MQKHDLKMTPGRVNRVTYEVEPPWKCANCGRYFHRHTGAETCKSPKPEPSTENGLARVNQAHHSPEEKPEDD